MHLPPRLKALADRVAAFVVAHPRLLALVSFCSGAASFVLVNRQNRSAAVIASLLMLSWLWLLLENVLSQWLVKRYGRQLSPAVVRYFTQMIHQESLFFVLPFFFVTAYWFSGQAVVVALLVVAGLVSIIDPVYYGRLAKNRWVYLCFHTLTLFFVLLTALPVILHLSTLQTYQVATGAALLFATPSLLRLVPADSAWRSVQVLAVAGVLGSALWWGRYWVPPATLWLSKVAVATELRAGEKAPAHSLREVTAARLRAEGLYAYTAIRAPRGLKERIEHVWLYEGREVDRIPLAIHGGRKEGYRTWTHKLNFPDTVIGDWQVRVLTESGQMIGVVRFRVVES